MWYTCNLHIVHQLHFNFKKEKRKSPIRVVPLLQLINLHRHIIISLSPQVTLGFTIGGVYPKGFDRWRMSYTHHYSIFTPLKIQ